MAVAAATAPGRRRTHSRSLLRRLAYRAPVAVFVADGCGNALAANELAADARIRLVDSPRRASVLLAVGAFPGHLEEALRRVHDQLPHPRAFLWWAAPGAPAAGLLERATRIPAGPPGGVPARGGVRSMVAEQLVAFHRRLLDGTVESYADVRPDSPPNDFEGLGDHGQGGEGMMGGVPWGRPMAMTGEDRDGLALDRIETTLGPFLVGMPAATAAHVVLQGGVIQDCELVAPPPCDGPAVGSSEGGPSAVCRDHLRWLVGACRLGGLDALATRAATVASDLGPQHHDTDTAPVSVDPNPAALTEAIVGLCRAVRRSGLGRTWRGVGGELPGDPLDASGRLERRLGLLDAFARSPGPGDPTARWTSEGTSDGRLEEIAEALRGLEWTDALVTLCSLDLRLEGSSAHLMGAQGVGEPEGRE